jgi:O-6-methylguanine DNA methyltransferase
MRFRIELRKSPVSMLLLVTDVGGALCALDFADHEARATQLMSGFFGDYEIEKGPAPAAITIALDAYFDGHLEALKTVRVSVRGTPFQKQVWNALRKIPPAQTRTYGQLAASIGRPGASRAVGAANHCNPIGIVVPCHRVIGADGSLTGYAGGLERKQWLLDHERRFAPVAAGTV